MAGYFLLSRKCAFGPLGLVNGGDNLSHAANYIVTHNDLLPRSGTSKMASGVAFITASAAWRWLQSDSTVCLIDIRSTPEFLFVGHPVPYMFRTSMSLIGNPTPVLLLGYAICCQWWPIKK